MLQQRSAKLRDDDMMLNSFKQIERVEWDTMLFFFGIIFAVSGLGELGYLGMASQYFYSEGSATAANFMIGILSAIVDNIPLMFAVLNMNPEMSIEQWQLITLTTGVGGSLLAIGFSCRRSAHGTGAWALYLHQSLPLDLGHCLGLPCLCRIACVHAPREIIDWQRDATPP